jgi:hypothetical protein
VASSAHFRYFARANDPNICSGVVDQLEAHLQAINNYLGLTWTGGVIDYYKFRDAEDLHANSDCGPTASGCASHDVRSARPLDGHELVHVYASSFGDPPALFAEGIAEALSPQGRPFPAPARGWRDVLVVPSNDDGSLADINYWAGGWFVTYLLRKAGPEPFLAFYKGAALDHSADAIARQFQTVYGVSIDDEWSKAQTSAPTLGGVPVWECASAEPLVMEGEAVTLADHCDGRGNVGGLQLERPTTFTWLGGSMNFSISSCSLDSGLYAELAGISFTPGAVALPAGKYSIGPDDSSGTIGFREANGVLSTNCNSLTPLTLRQSGSAQGMAVMIANADVPWFAMPQLVGAGSFRFSRLPDIPFPAMRKMVATVEACDSCQGPCILIDSASGADVSAGMVLRFTNLADPEGATVTQLAYE